MRLRWRDSQHLKMIKRARRRDHDKRDCDGRDYDYKNEIEIAAGGKWDYDF